MRGRCGWGGGRGGEGRGTGEEEDGVCGTEWGEYDLLAMEEEGEGIYQSVVDDECCGEKKRVKKVQRSDGLSRVKFVKHLSKAH